MLTSTPRRVTAFFLSLALSVTCAWAADPKNKHEHSEREGTHSKYTIVSAKSGNWSDKNTWQPQRVPRAGDRVYIQPKTRVMYDVASDAVIRSIKVSGELHFAQQKDTVLNVGVIHVSPSGAGTGEDAGVEDVEKKHNHKHDHKPTGEEAVLAVGAAHMPISAKHTARIRLHFLEGMTKDNEPAIIARPGGRMEFHGSPMNRTWVKLGANLTKGDTRVTLSENVTGWRAGDEVIVTASNRGGSGGTFRKGGKYAKDSQTEPRRIKAIETIKSGAGETQIITLDKPLEFEHFGDGEFRSEIANLSRNVIVESAKPQGVRGHTMFHWASKGSISYARFAHLGKENTLGRYPIHFHLVEDSMRGSSVIGAAIVDSHNRWVTVHGTQYMLVRDCVGYQSVGHGYFLEDATEVYNLLDRNLAVQAYTGPRMKNQALRFDPNDGAGFWWSNGRNSFTRNVSCENDEYGYRYDMQHSRYQSSVLPIRQPDGKVKDVDVRTIPIWRFDNNEAHSEGFYGMTVAANGGSQPDSPIKTQKQLDYFKTRIDWTGPDTKHPHTITNLSIWHAHYAFRPHSPAMLMENIRLHGAAYGVYRPAFENHVYRNLHISKMGAEPFNRGMDDASAQTGTITVDGLTFTETGYGGKSNPLIHMSDNNLSGDAETHIRNLKVERTAKYTDRWPTLNIGGGARADPITEKTVPYFIHDYYGKGRHAKVVTVKSKDHLNDGNKYESAYPLTGPDALVAEVKDVTFPKVLDPTDDQPPATTILSVKKNKESYLITGITHDNGDIVSVQVNGSPATLTQTTPGVVDWFIVLDTKHLKQVSAGATDASGNAEITPHLLPIHANTQHGHERRSSTQ